MHATLLTLTLTLAAAAAASDPRSPAHRSHVRSVQKLTTTIPSGWKLFAACLTDSPAPARLLSTSSNYLTTLTPGVCTASCESAGYRYAGLQDGHECWCGNELNISKKAGVRMDVAGCNMPCAGDADTMCGGYYAVRPFSFGDWIRCEVYFRD